MSDQRAAALAQVQKHLRDRCTGQPTIAVDPAGQVVGEDARRGRTGAFEVRAPTSPDDSRRAAVRPLGARHGVVLSKNVCK